jgi:hypothetical protein
VATLLQAFPECPGEIRVDGSVAIRRASSNLFPIGIEQVSVGGSVAVENNTGTTKVFVVDSFAGGSVSFRNNNADANNVANNTIDGSVSFVNNNAALSDGNLVANNTIDGSLACSENTPPPTLSGFPPNTVDGSKSGQSAGL